MEIVRTVAAVRSVLGPLRNEPRIGLVPTMGALHAGHTALFRSADAVTDYVVASLFVNPTQFGNAADLAAYPRDEPRDARIAEESGVDLLFAPGVEEMFAPDHATWVAIEGAALGLEGEFRPNHFRGVATVCLKLFSIIRPHVALFGQKDAQQVAVIKQLVRDFNLEIEIRVEPTVRDADGLALSSRNVRLSVEERARALSISRALRAGQAAYRAGGDAVAAARALLVGVEPEYVAVADFDGQPTLAIAARVGATRLIDNIHLGER
jgi:pantoate--beta-alanine ligase